jgi:hypothetical protein
MGHRDHESGSALSTSAQNARTTRKLVVVVARESERRQAEVGKATYGGWRGGDDATRHCRHLQS